MALYKREDFCKLIGLQSRELSTYIKRGKVFLSGELIDDAITQNAEFMQKRAEILLKKNGGTAPPVTTEVHNQVSPNYQNIKHHQFKEVPPPAGDKTPIVELERTKLILGNIKTTEEIEKIRLHNAKAAGESIPIDVVKVVVAQLAKGFITSFQNSSENFLIEISKKVGMDRVMLADSKGLLFKNINEAINKAVDESKKQITDIVKEYAIKKEQGERE
jgi:hypothetical protein